MPTTNYGDIEPRSAGQLAARLLERGQHDMLIERFGTVAVQDRNNTRVQIFRRYESLQRATAPLAEGIPPTGQQLTFTDLPCTLEQYGDAVKLTDVVFDTHEDGVSDETVEICAEQAAETIEVVRIAIIKSGTNVYYPAAATTRATVDSPITRGVLREVYRGFRRNKGRQISKIIPASAMVSTQPVESAFFVMGSTDLDADFRGLSGFVPVAQYSDSRKAVASSEIGTIDQFRICLTALFEPWLAAGVAGTDYLSGGAQVSGATACDVYPVIVVARDSYGIVPLQGENAIEPGVVMPKKTDSDPLGQVGWVSWKTYQTAIILNHSWLARIEVSATAALS